MSLGTRPKRVTIDDLAAELGLSKSAVSNALNGQPGVSEKTRQRVVALAESWSWRPHQGARALRKQLANTIGIVLDRDPQQVAYEPFYSLVVGGMNEVLVEHDYSLLMRMNGQHGDDLQVYREWAREGRVDGVVIFDGRNDDPRPALLEELDVSAVLIGSFEYTPAGMIQLTDNVDSAARLILEHLCGLGHRTVGVIQGPRQLLHEQLRAAAMVAIAAGLGIELVTTEANYTVQGGYSAVGGLLARQPTITAIVGSNDVMTLGAMRWLLDDGLGVPENVSVLSWDDSQAGQLVSPRVTALNRKPMEIGRLAARCLVLRVQGEPLPDLLELPPPELVLGASTGPSRVTIR